MFVGIHALLAQNTKTPEIEITHDEGVEFMERAGNVMRHYAVQTTQKTMDWIAFVGVAAVMYIPRTIAISNRRQMERHERAMTGVVPLRLRPARVAPQAPPVEQPLDIQPDMREDDLI